MRLSIIEAGLSRRGFLKKSLAGAVSLSPIGKILAAGGVAPSFESRLNNALSIVENKRIRFASFNSYGDITVYIDGKKYMYNTDAIYHNKWKKKARYRSFDVLNDIKDQVKRGYATQIYP
jgi:hypothetical protein